MRKLNALLTVVGLGLGLGGCNLDTSSPEGSLNYFWSTIQTQNYNSFHAMLTGKALVKYGSEAGLQELTRHINGATVQSVEKVGEPEVEFHWYADNYPIKKTYTLSVALSHANKANDNVAAVVVCNYKYRNIGQDYNYGTDPAVARKSVFCQIADLAHQN